MKLLVAVKQLGRKKPVIGEREIEVPAVSTLRALLTEIVTQEVAAYNARAADDPSGDATEAVTLLAALSGDEIRARAEAGKVGFGLRYNRKKQDLQAAIDNALLSFEDGLYRVFVNDGEAAALDAPLVLNEHDKLTFVRLTMLAGRLW